MNNLKLSIGMLVYNHEKYIAQAIESILMQKVNFKYEVLIYEDCSTDKSREIIEKYRMLHPDIIKVNYNKENLGMKQNVKNLRLRLKGEYTAALEGDDYWLDEHKLQKQVDFLDKNQDYSMVAHNVIIVDQNGTKLDGTFKNEIYPVKKEGDFLLSDFENGHMFSQTASILCRNNFNRLSESLKENYFNCIANGDKKSQLLNLLYGKAKFLPDFMSAHRVVFNEGDSWTAKTYNKNINLFNYESLISLEDFAYLINKTKLNMDNAKKNVIISALIYVVKNNNKINKDILKNIWKIEKNKVLFFRALIGLFVISFNKIKK